MVMPGHLCPFGLKALDLLEREGFTVEDHHLTSKEATESFKAQHQVKTTPQTFIDGKRVGGYDDLRSYFGKSVRDPKALTYRPVIVVFVMAFLMAGAFSWAANGALVAMKIAESFIAISTCILALLKLQDIESFSNMFLGYDLLAQRYVPYPYVYPFAEGLAGIPMFAGRSAADHHPGCAFYRNHRRGLGLQGRLHREAITLMRLRRRQQKCAIRLCFYYIKSHDDWHGAIDDATLKRYSN